MITRDIAAFFDFASRCEKDQPSCAKGVFLVTPEGFSLATESAQDNAYMQMSQADGINSVLAYQQHQQLHHALSQYLPTISFAGRKETPDAVFPNNVFATINQKILLARMCHAVRQAEANRPDILGFFQTVMGYQLHDLRAEQGVGELTGSLIIDRARRIGFCGLSERCDEVGAHAMAAAMQLKACLLFDLAASEYHTNVVLSILASRAVVMAPDGFADPRVPAAIADFYAPHVLLIGPSEKQAFVANCIAVTDDTVWMSHVAERALSHRHRQQLAESNFTIHSVELSEIEKAGGSLRCCVAEIF